MTTLTKTLIATSLLLAAGVAYQINLFSRQRSQSNALAQKAAALDIQIGRIGEQRDRMLADLSAAQKMMESMAFHPNPTNGDSALSAWLGRVSQLEQYLKRVPGRGIPEMKYLNSNDWLSVTMNNPLDTDARNREALNRLRSLAKSKPQVATNLSNALQAYRKSNNGLLPTDPTQLRPYLNPQLPDELLRRYEPAPEVAGENDANGLIRDGMQFLGSGRVVLQEKAPVDDDYDTWFGFQEKGGWATLRVSQIARTVDQAMKAFRQANEGQTAATVEQLLPYLATPVEPARLKEYWEVSRH